ncbi:hypothetical protein SCLCIDRAFT_600668 [Scleroderma citrinum Foug A]|uniref:Uncharacterized protein n=1 Tax=Scleroderma citrinum Foug A TaxID=1036808 RepID=A0A0C3AJ21_9AGAM|nr:hypothetical protein SCLCIDRAFT_600668 [Scleroderma citrinum Foug A]
METNVVVRLLVTPLREFWIEETVTQVGIREVGGDTTVRLTNNTTTFTTLVAHIILKRT